MYRRSSYLILLFLLPIFAFGQGGLDTIDSLKTQLDKQQPDTLKVRQYAALVTALRQAQQMAEAFQYADLGITLAKELADNYGYALLLKEKATIYRTQNNFLDAIDLLKQSLTHLDEKHHKPDILHIHNIMGAAYARLGNLSSSLESAQKAFALAQNTGDKISASKATTSIAQVYGRMGNAKKELEYHQKTYQISLQTDDEHLQALALNNLGHGYKNLKEYKKAIDYLHKSMEMNKKNDNKTLIIYNYATLSEIYQHENSLDSAEYYARQSLNTSLEVNDPYEIAYGYNDIGRVQLGMQRYEEAQKNLYKAYGQAKQIQANEVLELSVKNLTRLYKETNRYDSAYRYLNEYLKIKENLLFEDSKRIADLQHYFAKEQKQSEKDLIKHKDALSKSKTRNKNILTFVAVVGVISVLLLIIWLFWVNKKGRKRNKVLLQQKENLEESSRQLSAQKEETQKLLNQMAHLGEIGIETVSSLDPEKIVETAYQRIKKIMPAEGFGIGMHNKIQESIDFPIFIEKDKKLPYSFDSLSDENRLSVVCFKKSEGIMINNYDEEYSKYTSVILPPNAGDSFCSILYYPLAVKSKIVGVITVQSFAKNAYTNAHFNLLKNIATYVAIAIENADTYRKIELAHKEINRQKDLIEEKNMKLFEQNRKVEQANLNTKSLSEIGIDITANLSVESVKQVVYQRISTIIDFDMFSIGLVNREKNCLDFFKSTDAGEVSPLHSQSLTQDRSLSVICYKTLREIIIADFARDSPKYLPSEASSESFTPTHSPQSIIFLPLLANDETLGVITVQSYKKNAYTEQDIDTFRSLAVYVAVALGNVGIFEKIERINRKVLEQRKVIEENNQILLHKNQEIQQSVTNLELLGKIGRNIIANLSVGKIVETVYENVNQLMDAAIFRIGVYDKHNKVLFFEGGVHQAKNIPVFGIPLSESQKLSVRCFESQEEIIVNDFAAHYQDFPDKAPKPPGASDALPASLVYLPITTKNKELGVLTVQSFQKNAYQTYQLTILRNLAAYIIIALENAILYENLEEQVEERTMQIVAQKEEIESSLKTVRTLSEIGQMLTGTLSVEDIIEKVYKNVNQLMDVSVFGIGVYEAEKTRIAFRNAYEDGVKLPDFYHHISERDRHSVRCFESQQEIITNDIRENTHIYTAEHTLPEGKYIRTMAHLPLNWEGKTIGVLIVKSFRKNAYQEQHLNILRNLVTYTSIALANAQAYAQIGNQNQKISEASEKIRSSINYAKRIQEAILPQRSHIRRSIPDSFILFKPRDVVSGDFFWFLQRKEKTFVAAVDCTGHGVPGAFMSMIGNNLLNEIISVLGVEEPNKILNALHIRIRRALKQDKNKNRDGMDIALCVIDHDKHILQFSGARNPLIYIDPAKNNEIHLIKGDRVSVGGTQREEARNFSPHEVALDENALKRFYIFSDGYQDQFGAATKSQPHGKRFMLRRLRESIVEMQEIPLRKQGKYLDTQLENWMGGLPQIDDILVIGFSA